MMTTTKDRTIAEVRAELDARRTRLAELQTGLNAAPAAIEHRRGELARAMADGAAESAVKKIRLDVAELEAERNGLEDAVELVRQEVEALEDELRPLVVAEFDAKADELRDEHNDALNDALEMALDGLEALEPLIRQAGATYRTALEARRAAMKAAGADSQDVYAAKLDPNGYPEQQGLGSGELHHRLLLVVRAMRDLAGRYGEGKAAA